MPLLYTGLCVIVSTCHLVRAWGTVLTHTQSPRCVSFTLCNVPLLACEYWLGLFLFWGSMRVKECHLNNHLVMWSEFYIPQQKLVRNIKTACFLFCFVLLTNSLQLDLKIVLYIDEDGSISKYRKSRPFLSYLFWETDLTDLEMRR